MSKPESAPKYSKLLSSIYKNFGRGFFNFQQWFFLFFFTAIIWDMIFQPMIKKELIVSGLPQQFLQATLWWLSLTLGTSAIWWLCVKFLDIDLWIYYYIWIPKLFPVVGKLAYRGEEGEFELVKLIKDSYTYESKGSRPCPVFVRREHLDRRSFWPHWEFSVIIMTRPGKFEISVAKSKSMPKYKRWVMVADLTNESFGIYNNAGKKFLRDRFKNPDSLKVMASLSKNFFDILAPNTDLGVSLRWGEVGEILPLRWVSGGFLPIVEFHDKNWVALFFRDISPIGLNIAIGGSETKSEYKDLHRLMGREFSEETVLLLSNPRRGARVPQQRFTVDQFGIETSEHISEYLNPEFVREHNFLRKQHDGFDIEILKSDDGRPITPIRTPFRVRVKYHSPDLRTIESKYYKNVIFTINPYEFSVEVVWLCRFNLDDGECLLDGEVDIGRNYLVRQPVILLSMDYLKNVFEKQGSLGSNVPGTDSKRLPPIAQEHFVVFDHDNDLRRLRLRDLEANIHSAHAKDRENLVYERDRLKRWIGDYDEAFSHLHQGEYVHESIRTLCPVTWKTLEIIFKHHIDYSV